MKTLILLSTLAVLILGGCATGTNTNVTAHAVPHFDPAKYNTFAILEQEEASADRTDPSVYRSAKMLMLGSLRSKGLTSTDVDSADLVFQAMGSAMPNANVANYGFFYYSYGWDWYPISYQTTSFTNSAQGNIIVNAFDTKTKELVWQGGAQATSTTSTIATEQALDALKQIMAEFPAK